MSARRRKTKFTQIHVSIPVRTLEDLDDTLDYNPISKSDHNQVDSERA